MLAIKVQIAHLLSFSLNLAIYFFVIHLYFQAHAMFCLHNNGYNVSKAIANLVPAGGPILCRDEMEEWSAGE